MKQKPFLQRIGDFMEGKGFYIVLFLCVTAIGISGYYLFSGLFSSQPLSMNTPTQQVSGHSQQVQVPAQNDMTPKTPVTTPATDNTNQAGQGATTKTEPAKASVFTWPLRGTISRDFSLEVFAYDATMGDWRTHSGLDIEAEIGSEVMAVSDGKVSDITDDPLMGTMVVIDHANGIQSVYANLTKQPTVKVGDQVSTGAVIGAIGDTAIAESAMPTHLHFEMMKDGNPVDPVSYFPEAKAS